MNKLTSSSISAPHIYPLCVGYVDKISIDTNTLIEIRNNSNDTDIYYTLDGSKPDGFVTLTTKRSTIQYKKPFYIPREIANAGRITVKAIAVSRDGIRESDVTTKTFNVKIVPSDHLSRDEYENRYVHELQQERKDLMNKLQIEHAQEQKRHAESVYRSITDSYYQSKEPYTLYSDSQTKNPRCAHCFKPKPNESFTRFCTECGLPWQKLTHNPPINYSTKTCSKCQSTIPFKSDKCVVCETPTSVEYVQPRADTRNQATIVCPRCKSSNPIHLRTCYICENVLMPTPTPQIRASVSVPSSIKPTDVMLTCSKCFRLNKNDANYCDWCGAEPERIPKSVQCKKCQSLNDPFARFCSTCGCSIEPVLRIKDKQIRNDSNGVASPMIINTLTNHSIDPTWLNSSITLNSRQPTFAVNRCDAATQTYGNCYPNTKDVDNLINQNKQLLEEQKFKDQYPILTSVSPGKGYWKKQLDHICAHLKAFAVNRPEFRLLIGEPRMSKMVHGVVHETEHQVNVQLVFQKPENLSKSSTSFDHVREHYPIHNDSSSTYSSVSNSDGEYSKKTSGRRKPRKHSKKRPSSANNTHIESGNHALVRLFERNVLSATRKKSHENDTLELARRLIKEKKANPNSRNKDGYTVLQLAVRNGYTDCLQTLITDGKAKLDERGPRGTTALHECCLLGTDGIEPLEILLKNGGNVSWINDKNETVVDLASKVNCAQLLQVIAKHRGNSMISQQIKSYDTRARIKSFDSFHLSDKS